MIKLHKKIYSEQDNTIKYVFEYLEPYYIEFSYIDKNDGKDIICVPCQTMCNQRCKFCHTNDYVGKIRTEDIDHQTIKDGVDYILADLELSSKELLVSFMGIGEPMMNMENVFRAIECLNNMKNTRFAVATSLPKFYLTTFVDFAERIKYLNANVKIHLSLHHTSDKERKKIMPNASKVKESILALKLYKEITGNDCEIHYTLIDGVNDKKKHFKKLAKLFKNSEISIKFLYYNERDCLDFKKSSEMTIHKNSEILFKNNIDYEYYIPPGLDIGASCGQFMMEIKS